MMEGFPEYTIKVPITLKNTFTKKQKDLLLVSDWISVSKLNHQAYKPDVALSIFCTGVHKLKLEKEEMTQVQFKSSILSQVKSIKTHPHHAMKSEKKETPKKSVKVTEKKENKKNTILKNTQAKLKEPIQNTHLVKPIFHPVRNVMHLAITMIAPPTTGFQGKTPIIHHMEESHHKK